MTSATTTSRLPLITQNDLATLVELAVIATPDKDPKEIGRKFTALLLELHTEQETKKC